MATDTDEGRWAEAQSLLDRTSTESAARLRARERYDRRIATAALVLAGVAVVLALVLLAVDPPPDPGDDPPAWRAVTGFSVAGLGLVFMIFAPLARPFGSRSGLVRPLGVLERRQRKELQEQVRRRAPVLVERLDLARREAEVMLDQRATLVVQTGLMVSFVGMWIADRSLPRTLLTVAMIAVIAVAAVHFRRDERLARRFLAEHPRDGG